jgi:hypothetical protein
MNNQLEQEQALDSQESQEAQDSQDSQEALDAQESQDSPEQVPEASDIELSCVVITIDICKELNLYVISKYIEISPNHIVGIKFKTRNKLIVRGEIKNNESKKKNSKRPDFSNQCSINYKYNNRVFNVKVFGNGNFVITGCKHKDESLEIVKSICSKIQNLNGILQYNLEENDAIDYQSYLKNKKKMQCSENILNYIQEKYNIFYKNFLENNKKLNLILLNIYMICRNYYKENTLQEMLLSKENIEIIDTIVNISISKKTMLITYNFPAYIGEHIINYIVYTSNINTMFYSNFYIKPIEICRIIKQKYKYDKDGKVIMSAFYSPDNYQAVKCTYISRIDCNEKEHVLCKHKNKDKLSNKCKCKCMCKNISISIFKGKTGFSKGSTIINGANTWSQILDTYEHIKKIYKENYKEISFNIENKQKDDEEMIKVKNKDGTTRIFVSKTFILKNQNNLPILAKNKLLHLFK